MSEYLVLRMLSDQPGRVSWVVADSSAPLSSMPETGSLTDAARRAQSRPVIVLVPGEDVLLTRIDLPVRGKAKMLQAVPFALEEQLADRVSSMHFALGSRDATGKILVAAVRDQLMQDWMAQLDDAGLEAACVLPETVGIPVHEGWSILIDGANCLIRDGQNRALISDTDTAAAFVGAMATDDQTATPSQLYVSETDAARYAQVLSQIRIHLPETTVTDLRHGALPIMAKAAIKSQQPNLLQGDYARTGGREALWGPWRAAILLAGVFIMAALGAKALEVMSLKSELSALNAELNEIAGEVMPGRRIVEPLLQLEQLASSLAGGGRGADTDFLDMLDSVSRALTSAGGTTLEKLDYRNGTMDLTLTAPSVDTLDQISREIGGGGLTAEIQSARQSDEVVQGRLRVSGQDT